MNCNLCESQLCYLCTDYEGCETTSDACIDNASPTPCECDPGYFWDEVNETCALCDTKCETCSDNSLFGCLTCNSGYFFLSGICRDYCPYGYNTVGRTCSP